MDFNDLQNTVKDTIQRNEHLCPVSVLQTNFVKLKGIVYRVGSVLLQTYNKKILDFCVISQIYVSNNIKYIQCKRIGVTDFNPILNAFACFKTEEDYCSPVIDMKYKWP